MLIGRLHPLVVHLPIGILLFAGLLEVLRLESKKGAAVNVVLQIAYLVAFVTALFAAIAGYTLSADGGYNENTLFWHQWSGISVVIISLLLFIIKCYNRYDRKLWNLHASQWLLTTVILFVAIAGHFGGTLTHGEHYLSAYLPASLKELLGIEQRKDVSIILPEQIDSIIVFTHVIQPILEKKCVRCHNASKLKGGLDMTSTDSLLRGGRSGKAISPGDLDKSEIFRRVTLAKSSSKFMPAENYEALTPIELNLLQWWIESGAGFNSKLSTMGADDKMKYLLSAYLGMDHLVDATNLLPTAPNISEEDIERLRTAGLVVNRISNSSNLLDVSFVMMRSASSGERSSILKKLLAIKENIFWLDLSDIGIEDGDMGLVGEFVHVQKLQVQRNRISSTGLKSLATLQQLMYLNVHSNNLDDTSIGSFEHLPNLQKVILWNNRFSPAIIEQLRTRPKPIFVTGG